MREIKESLSPTKANIKPLITNGMYDHINNNPTGEGGIYLKRDANGNLTSEPAPYTNTNMVDIKAGGIYYAGIHSHPNDTYPMFSWSDIYVLYTLEKHAASFNKNYPATYWCVKIIMVLSRLMLLSLKILAQ